jgi:hypothetical protein
LLHTSVTPICVTCLYRQGFALPAPAPLPPAPPPAATNAVFVAPISSTPPHSRDLPARFLCARTLTACPATWSTLSAAPSVVNCTWVRRTALLKNAHLNICARCVSLTSRPQLGLTSVCLTTPSSTSTFQGFGRIMAPAPSGSLWKAA